VRCVAIIQAARPGIDSVLIWENNDRLIAFAYLDGRVSMTRPLEANTLDQAATETLTAFQIPDGQLTRLSEWSSTQIQGQAPVAVPKRWE
jgi:hypothetical protein